MDKPFKTLASFNSTSNKFSAYSCTIANCIWYPSRVIFLLLRNTNAACSFAALSFTTAASFFPISKVAGKFSLETHAISVSAVSFSEKSASITLARFLKACAIAVPHVSSLISMFLNLVIIYSFILFFCRLPPWPLGRFSFVQGGIG